MADTKISGTVLRSTDGAVYFIPDAQLEECRLPAEAAAVIEQWLSASDVAGHGGSTVGVAGTVALSAGDPGADAVRAALDPLIGPTGYIRRCLNVVPADLLDLVAEIDRQAL